MFDFACLFFTWYYVFNPQKKFAHFSNQIKCSIKYIIYGEWDIFWFWSFTSRKEQNCYFQPFFSVCVSKTDNFKLIQYSHLICWTFLNNRFWCGFEMKCYILYWPHIKTAWSFQIDKTITTSFCENNIMFPLIYKLFFYSSIHSNFKRK